MNFKQLIAYDGFKPGFYSVFIDFKVGEKEVIMGQEIEKTSANKANVFDLPVFLGAGVKIFFLTIEARYSWGMIDVYDGTANSEYDDSKTQYLQVGAAISF